MTERIPVFVFARDQISQLGMATQLRGQPAIHLVEEVDVDAARVALVIADEVDTETARVIQAIQRNGCPRVVAVVTKVDDAGLLAAVEAGTCAIVRRADARTDVLIDAVRSADAGDGTIPPDLLGRLLDHVSHLQATVLAPRGLSFSGLTTREVDVLRLLADGYDTTEVASSLSYSERTVKNVVADVTRRHGLRNRTHAVAYALRQGLI
jgi:DNA-binding NarL/FixJ family response regulator